jgi:hypothetical protein
MEKRYGRSWTMESVMELEAGHSAGELGRPGRNVGNPGSSRGAEFPEVTGLPEMN